MNQRSVYEWPFATTNSSSDSNRTSPRWKAKSSLPGVILTWRGIFLNLLSGTTPLILITEKETSHPFAPGSPHAQCSLRSYEEQRPLCVYRREEGHTGRAGHLHRGSDKAGEAALGSEAA